MHAEFKSENAVIRVSTSNHSVSLTIEHPGDESVVVHLPQSLARAIGSTLVGAAADIKKDPFNGRK